MDNCKHGPMLEDTLTPKCLPMSTFLPMKEKGKRIPKVEGSSTNLMTLIEELPAWEPSKIRTP